MRPGADAAGRGAPVLVRRALATPVSHPPPPTIATTRAPQLPSTRPPSKGAAESAASRADATSSDAPRAVRASSASPRCVESPPDGAADGAPLHAGGLDREDGALLVRISASEPLCSSRPASPPSPTV